MNQNTNDTSESNGTPMAVHSEWSAGPRIAAWDRLWRLVLTGLNARPAEEGREQRAREVRDTGAVRRSFRRS